MSPEPPIEISAPRRFTARAIFILNCFGLLALIPVVLLVPAAIFIFLKTGSFGAFILIVLATAFFPIFFFPLILGNSYVTKLVNSYAPIRGGEQFVVQLTRSPRIRSGFRAVMEDADDVGRLSIDGEDLIFEGDSVKFRLAFSHVTRVESRNIGWRGMWICSPRICVTTSGLAGVTVFEFCERSSLTVPESRRNSFALKAELLSKLNRL